MSFYSNGKGVALANQGGDLWYHGSQVKMTILKAGSSITKNKELATAFSHRPTQVSVDDFGVVHHDGQTNGYLYVIDEDLNDKDVKVHESCSSEDPWELITTRELKLKLIRETNV